MINYKELIEKAQNALNFSYSPYSNFKVGACVLTKLNKTYIGANIENATFGATICAERVAIDSAIMNNDKEIVCIAIVSKSGDYTFPCGICRQVMAEFSSDLEIVVATNQEDYKIYKLEELLPHSFLQKDIK